VASLLLILLLAVFAYALAHSQQQQRQDLERRFQDRAKVAATVNESLFALATSSAKTSDIQRFGSKTVNQKLLQQTTAAQQQTWSAIYTKDGKLLASAGPVPSTPPAILKASLGSPSVVYSSLMRGAGGATTIQSALAYPTKYGVRVSVAEGPAAPLSQFLTSFLSRLPNVSDARSYVVDKADKIIATPGSKTRPGVELPDAALAKKVGKQGSGSYAGDRYFVSAPISSTPWLIVLAAAKKNLYSSVKTTASWVIFIAFVLVSLGGMILLWRVLISNAELQRADLSRRHALEINDNVVQRLVLAKYALDRGATETSQQKLAETLRETQQLVTSMLEEREIAPGALRRDAPAETEGNPDPATRQVPEVRE
jgi:hypothetical protein